jgi:hypothetical protein
MKNKFINDEIWMLTFSGAFGTRSKKVYKSNSTNEQKGEFKNYVKEYIGNLIDNKFYASVEVKSENHIENLVRFCDDVSKKFGNILDEERLRIGIGQKIFNLYLKYLWCLDKIAVPPHCPFDGYVIKKLGSKVVWTETDKIEDYKELIDLASEKACNKSIAEWELEWFNSNRS